MDMRMLRVFLLCLATAGISTSVLAQNQQQQPQEQQQQQAPADPYTELNKQVQEALRQRGLYNGPVNGVIGPIAQGAWVAFWTPWNPGVGTVNTAATVASPAAIAPGGITLSGRKVKGVKRLSGRVTQAGAGVATRVTIFAGTKRLATVGSRANGAFTYAVPKKSKATTFRARAVVASHDAPAVCGQFGSLGVPCVNATVSGFTANSRAVRLR